MSEVDLLSAQWSVKPHRFKFDVNEWRAHTKGCSAAGGLGCLSTTLVFMAALWANQFPAMREMHAQTWWLGFLSVTIIVLLLLSFVTYYALANAKRKREAIAATTEARVRFSDMGAQSTEINASIERALFYLYVADRELHQHRYAPFWDAMESAASAIGQCHTCHGYLAFDIDQYVNALLGRTHDFPSWDQAVVPIREIAPTLERFAALKHAAEADYHFASIREIRETRKVVIAGFSTLGEVLRHLETTVPNSITDLKRAVNRSLLLRAADPERVQVVASFLIDQECPNPARKLI